jgi:hypothetical protein
MSENWRSRGLDGITAPVVAGGCVYLADSIAHRLIALHADTGRIAWTVAAEGRIDLPPIVTAGGLCLFGSHDGRITCVRSSDGAMLWRALVAPQDRWRVSHGAFVSAWPISSLVVFEDKCYALAGISGSVDGGAVGVALDLADGSTAFRLRQEGNVQGNWLSASDEAVFLKGRPFASGFQGPEGDTRRWRPDAGNLGTGHPGDGFFAALQSRIVHNGPRLSRQLIMVGGGAKGALAAWDGEMSCAASPGFHVVTNPKNRDPDRCGLILATQTVETERGVKPKALWRFHRADDLHTAPVALVLAANTVLMANTDIKAPERNTLTVFERATGAVREEIALPAPPVDNGVAVTDAGVFLTLSDGSVLKLAEGADAP